MAAKNCQPKKLQVTRLKKRADFLNARSGARSHERAFVLQLVKRESDAISSKLVDDIRVGFTVTKKVGNAVVRNRIKRRLREAVEATFFTPAAGGHDAVLIARIEALDEPFDNLVVSFGHALRNALHKQNKTKPNVAKSAKGRQKLSSKDAG